MANQLHITSGVVDSRCGLHCTGCTYKTTCGCGGCIETNGNPFHGECPVAKFCQNKGFTHCGECPDIPCNLLNQYSCDPEQGDTPQGARIEQCRRWGRMTRSIEEIIADELSLNDQKTALKFVKYLHQNSLTLVRDSKYWKDKIYYHVKLSDQCICFIAIKDPDEPENRWTVWSDDISSDFLENYPIKEKLKETAWKYIDFCDSCGSCGGGRNKKIFGRTFENVCGCTFRIDNPDMSSLDFLKKIVEIRIAEISQKIASENKNPV